MHNKKVLGTCTVKRGDFMLTLKSAVSLYFRQHVKSKNGLFGNVKAGVQEEKALGEWDRVVLKKQM